VHGPPWPRASVAIKRHNVEGRRRLGDSGVLIGCVSRDDDIVFYLFSFNFGFLGGELDLLRLQHNHVPYCAAHRAAGILRMRGYMLGISFRLYRLQIVTPINVFNGAAGKSIRITSRKPSECLFLILRLVDDR